MRIIDCWGLHYEAFLLQVEGTKAECDSLGADLNKFFPKKVFYIVRITERGAD